MKSSDGKELHQEVEAHTKVNTTLSQGIISCDNPAIHLLDLFLVSSKYRLNLLDKKDY